MAIRREWLFSIGAVALVLFGPGTYQLAVLSIQQHRMDRRLAALQSEHQRLVQEQARLQSDPAYLEGLIRTTFKVSAPSEYVLPLDSEPRRH